MLLALSVSALALRAAPRAAPRLSASPSALSTTVDDDAWEAWPRSWVPLASTFELDPERPTPVRFLGKTFVVWQDNDAEWRVFRDACPHRLAPLSEGRIDRQAGTLECAYHGWAFTESGTCARIPQMEDGAAAKARASPRACATAYPVEVEKSVVFCWPWGGAPIEPSSGADGTPAHMLQAVKESAATYTRELPYGWDALLENIVDPSHVPFAHHGLQGTRDDAVPVNMSSRIEVRPGGFEFQFADRTLKKRRAGTGSFYAPYVVSYKAAFEASTPSPFDLVVAMTPAAPGWLI